MKRLIKAFCLIVALALILRVPAYAEDEAAVFPPSNIEEIMPKKIEYNLRYINNRTLKEYFKIIFLTFAKILKH